MNLHLLECHQNAYKKLESVYLPDNRNEKVLILDIDETMIHTIDERDPSSMKGKYELYIPDCE